MLIGSMKCGTSTLYSHLIKHPQICPGKMGKEPQYFSLKTGKQNLKQLNYEDLFDIDLNKHAFTLDASTSYTKYPAEKGVPDRIKEYGLNPFFIYIIRNPFERITSHYNFMQRDLSWKDEIDSLHLINTSKYFTQLQEYEKVFPESRILLVEFDELKNDPLALCNKIFNFIGADKFEIPFEENLVKNRTKAVNKKQLAIEKRYGSIGRYFPSFIKRAFRKMVKVAYPEKQKVLTDIQKEKIREHLTGDMTNLQRKYGIKISKWGF